MLESQRRRRRVACAVDDELELLSDPTAHDRIITVERHRESLAIEDLVSYPRVDQSVEFVRCCRALPDALELRLQTCELTARHDDFIGTGIHAALQVAIQAEQQGPIIKK